MIADSAYCLLCTPELLPKKGKKEYKFSLMPHYRQMDKINWNIVSKLTGIHIIDPRKSINFILEEINKSEKLLSIAMHGAIVADILRVPWLRIKMDALGAELPYFSDIKWLDFLNALNLENHYLQIKNYIPFAKKNSAWYWISFYERVNILNKSKKCTFFQLSTHEKIFEIKEKLETEIIHFIEKYS